MTLLRRCVIECVGTAFLLIGVVGSGIMAERLSGGNVALALLANSIATGGILFCLIAALGSISGGHFNPAVSLANAFAGGLHWREVPSYIGSQVAGGVAGVAVANVMFGLPALFVAHHARAGANQCFAEFVATFGLLLVIWGCGHNGSRWTPLAVAAYIVGAYWFTSSTSFANPAVTIARSLSDTFAGIRPADVAPFVLAQIVGALMGTALFSWLGALPKRLPRT